MTYIGGDDPMLQKSQERQERIEAQFRDHIVQITVAAVNANQPVNIESLPQIVKLVGAIYEESEKYWEDNL